MKHKKSLLIIAIFACIFCFMLALTPSVVACAQQETEDVVTGEENATFFGRIWEYIENNFDEIATGFMGVAVMSYGAIQTIIEKKRYNKLDYNVVKLSSKQNEEIAVTNNLIESYNALTIELKEMREREKDLLERFKATTIQTATILDVLSTVYANSKNVPQGVKDLINLKYAKALKNIEEEATVDVAEDLE